MLQYSNKFDNKYKKRYLLKIFYVLIFPGVTLIQRQNIFKKHFILKKKHLKYTGYFITFPDFAIFLNPLKIHRSKHMKLRQNVIPITCATSLEIFRFKIRG